MNAWQILQQAQYLLRQKTWEDGSTLVFDPNSVVVSAAVAENALAELVLPIAMVSIGGGGSDPDFREDPTIRRREVRVTIGTMNENDRLGQATLIGARSDGVNDSRGRGLLEIEEQVDLGLDVLNAANGVRIAFAASSAAEPARHPGTPSGIIIMETLAFDATLTRARTYQPATSIVAAGATPTWKYPGLRFDTRRAILRYRAGAAAPTSPTSGLGIPLGGSPDGSGAVAVPADLRQILLSAFPVGAYDAGETLVQASTGATAVLADADGGSTPPRIYVRSITGAPDNAHAWVGATHGTSFSPTTAPIVVPGTGTWSYGLWIAYDETGSGTDERFSAPLSLLSVVVP